MSSSELFYQGLQSDWDKKQQEQRSAGTLTPWELQQAKERAQNDARYPTKKKPPPDGARGFIMGGGQKRRGTKRRGTKRRGTKRRGTKRRGAKRR